MNKKILFLLLIFAVLISGGCISDTSWKKEISFVSPSTFESVSNFIKPRKYLSMPTEQQISIDGADILLEVDSVKLRFGEIMAFVKQYGGRPVNSQIARMDGDKYFAFMIVKVPKKQFSELISRVDSFGKVLKQGVFKKETPFDISAIKLKLNNCVREENHLRSMLKKTKKVDDVIRLEKRLSALKERKMILKSDLIAAKQMSWYAVINLYLREKESMLTAVIWLLLLAVVIMVLIIIARKNRLTKL